jgi:hypothetical protein
MVEVLIFIENEPKGIQNKLMLHTKGAPLKFNTKSSKSACDKNIKHASPSWKMCGDRIHSIIIPYPGR